MKIRDRGLEADLPPGWEGRIHRRPAPAGATTNAVLHAASFPLPEERGDFGDGATESMGPGDVFVALVEYDPEAAGSSLFQRRGLPRRIRSESVRPDRLQRAIPGQAGTQLFFTENGRAFCLYVVVGNSAARSALLARAEALLRTVSIDHR